MNDKTKSTLLTIFQALVLYQLAYVLMDEYKKSRELPTIKVIAHRMWPFGTYRNGYRPNRVTVNNNNNNNNNPPPAPVPAPVPVPGPMGP